MLDSLPAELVLAILRIAAESMLVTDRKSVVSLAQTARFVYSTVAPVLYRRAVVTSKNGRSFGLLMLNADACALVRDLMITWFNWTPEENAIVNFTGLVSIAGITGRVQYLLDHIHSDSKQSLRIIQSWNLDVLNNVPQGVTHVCLYMENPDQSPLLSGLFQWMKCFPSITHLGLDMVLHNEHMFGLDSDSDAYDAQRRQLAQAVSNQLVDVLAAGGIRLQQLAARIGGIMSDDVPWETIVQTLRERAGNGGVDQRIRLWRDQRPIDHFTDDLDASIDDGYNGRNVWTEAQDVPAL